MMLWTILVVMAMMPFVNSLKLLTEFPSPLSILMQGYTNTTASMDYLPYELRAQLESALSSHIHGIGGSVRCYSNFENPDVMDCRSLLNMTDTIEVYLVAEETMPTCMPAFNSTLWSAPGACPSQSSLAYPLPGSFNATAVQPRCKRDYCPYLALKVIKDTNSSSCERDPWMITIGYKYDRKLPIEPDAIALRVALELKSYLWNSFLLEDDLNEDAHTELYQSLDVEYIGQVMFRRESPLDPPFHDAEHHQNDDEDDDDDITTIFSTFGFDIHFDSRMSSCMIANAGEETFTDMFKNYLAQTYPNQFVSDDPPDCYGIWWGCFEDDSFPIWAIVLTVIAVTGIGAFVTYLCCRRSRRVSRPLEPIELEEDIAKRFVINKPQAKKGEDLSASMIFDTDTDVNDNDYLTVTTPVDVQSPTFRKLDSEC